MTNQDKKRWLARYQEISKDIDQLRETYWDGNAYQEVGEWSAYEEKEVD